MRISWSLPSPICREPNPTALHDFDEDDVDDDEDDDDEDDDDDAPPAKKQKS
jgi:hypothetical protein